MKQFVSFLLLLKHCAYSYLQDLQSTSVHVTLNINMSLTPYKYVWAKSFFPSKGRFWNSFLAENVSFPDNLECLKYKVDGHLPPLCFLLISFPCTLSFVSFFL